MLIQLAASSFMISVAMVGTAMVSHAQANNVGEDSTTSIEQNYGRDAGLLGPVVPATLPTNPPEVSPEAETGTQQTALTTDPAVEPQEILSQYGLVRFLQGDQLSVRLMDGSARTYKVAANNVALTFRRGSLVGFDVDGKGQITKLAPPRIRRVFEGTVIVVEENKLGLVSPTGERLVTSLSPDRIARMNIEPGRTLKVTQYENTWATKVCLPAENDVAAIVQPIPTASTAEAIGGAEFSYP